MSMNQENRICKDFAIEFAVEAKTEIEAMDRLKELGIKHADTAKLEDLDHQADLYMINILSSEADLSDSIYNNLLSARDVFILSDELSSARGEKILRLTSVVERQLKKLLICVLPEIEKVLMDIVNTHQKHNTKLTPTGRIEWCQKIHDFSFGEIPIVLENDVSKIARNKLGSGEAMLLLISESKDFDDLKLRIEKIFESKKVWDIINSILKKPAQYEYVSRALNKLIELRNNAAHQNTITRKMLDEAVKNQKHVMLYIGEIKSSYRTDLAKSMAKASETLRSLAESMMKLNNDAYQEYIKTMTLLYQPIIDSISKSVPDMSKLNSNAVSSALEGLALNKNLASINNELMKNIQQNIPEYDKYISMFRSNGFQRAIVNSLLEAEGLQEKIKKLKGGNSHKKRKGQK